MKMTLTLPHEVRGNGTKTTGSLSASQLLFLPLARFFSMCVPCISLFLSVLLHVCPCLARFLCPMSVSLSVAADVVSVAGSVASGR